MLGDAPLRWFFVVSWSDWSLNFRTFSDQSQIGLSSNSLSKLIRILLWYDYLFGMLPFWHDSLNAHCFQASVVSISFGTFPDTPLIPLSWNLVRTPIRDSDWSRSTEFTPSGLWFVKQFPRILKQTYDWIELEFDEQIHLGVPSTFDCTPLNFHRYLVFDWWISFCADKSLIGLSSNLVDQFSRSCFIES